MSLAEIQSTPPANQRIEELGRIILAFSEQTERLEQSHASLQEKVQSLRRELSEKNRLLERKNRLAALGEMAAGMAHEIRNPLGGIQLYASLLSQDLADQPASAALAEKISGGVRKLEWLVSQTLAFTREIKPTIGPADLAGIVSEAVGLAGAAITRKSVEVNIHGPGSFPVKVDANLVGQAVLNLILNAVEAVDERGEVMIEYGPPRDEVRQLVLSVRDTGPGIPPHILDRIFNPFFTTRETGTGLGLAIVHRVVEAHDGLITAANADGGGARFEISI
jgi:signal transduction histidine kinase